MKLQTINFQIVQELEFGFSLELGACDLELYMIGGEIYV